MDNFASFRKLGSRESEHNAVRQRDVLVTPGYLSHNSGRTREGLEDWHGGRLPTGEELLKSGLPTLNSIKATIY